MTAMGCMGGEGPGNRKSEGARRGEMDIAEGAHLGPIPLCPYQENHDLISDFQMITSLQFSLKVPPVLRCWEMKGLANPHPAPAVSHLIWMWDFLP